MQKKHDEHDLQITINGETQHVDHAALRPDGVIEIASSPIPVNPRTGEPYFEISEQPWAGKWEAGETIPIATRTGEG